MYHSAPKQQTTSQTTMSKLKKRHIKQIIRRNMITKVKPSSKVYNRKINKRILAMSKLLK